MPWELCVFSSPSVKSSSAQSNTPADPPGKPDPPRGSFLFNVIFFPFPFFLSTNAQQHNCSSATCKHCSGLYTLTAYTMCTCAGSVQTRSLQMASTQGNPADFFQHPTPLGSNLYDRDRARATPPEGRQIGFGGQPNSLPTTSTPAEPETPEKVCEEDKEVNSGT